MPRPIVVHMLSASVFPQPGGMQEAVLRVGRALNAREDLRVVIYTRKQSAANCAPHPLHEGLEVVHLGQRRARWLEPLPTAEVNVRDNTYSPYALETLRLDQLLLERAVGERMARTPGARHVLASFFVTGSGYIAQQTASMLGIPHVASVRGSDFQRDLRGPLGYGVFRFVADNAAAIVTTNRGQEEFLRATMPGACALRTIHNALSEESLEAPYWTAPEGREIRLISDSGFSVKKGTHVLVDAAARLRADGAPVRLTILGGPGEHEHEYWEAFQRRRLEESGDWLAFPGRVSAEAVERAFRESHILCSASLGEGCSHSHMRAMVLGMPMVATRVGMLPELAEDCPHVRLCAPADEDGFVAALRGAVADLGAGSLAVDRERVDGWRAHFSPCRELGEWEEVLRAAAAA